MERRLHLLPATTDRFQALLLCPVLSQVASDIATGVQCKGHGQCEQPNWLQPTNHGRPTESACVLAGPRQQPEDRLEIFVSDQQRKLLDEAGHGHECSE